MRAPLLLPVAALLACAHGERPAQAPATPTTPPVPAAIVPATASTSDVQGLHWLVGRWRGIDPTGRSAPFYESYQVVSDALISGNTWADSTFTRVTDTSFIQLSGSEIVTSSQGVVTKIDGHSVHFESRRPGGNAYTWTRDNADQWTAVLTWSGPDSVPQTKTYIMTRIAP